MVIYALLVAATLMVVAGLTIQLTRNYLLREIDRRLSAAVRSFREGPARSAGSPEELLTASRTWLEVQAFPAEQAAAVRLEGGEVLATTTGELDLLRIPQGRELLESLEPRWWNLETPVGPVRAVTAPLLSADRHVGTLVVAASRSGAEITLGGLVSGVGWATAVGLVFASLLGFTAVRRALRPLRKMSEQVELIQATGDLGRRVEHRGPLDEVGRLAQAFDGMLSRMEDAFNAQRGFIADASHELRTPLTVVRGQLELLQSNRLNSEAQESVRQALAELDRMGRTVEELLLLARLDEGLTFTVEPVEVELVMREALLRGMMEGQITAVVEVEPGLEVMADSRRLLQVLTNLVRNAVLYAGDDAEIVLRAQRENGKVLIEIADNGVGIDPGELPRIFDRFYRGSHARAVASGGAGLGLAIVASLTRAMGGDIEARSAPGVGTHFLITLRTARINQPEQLQTVG